MEEPNLKLCSVDGCAKALMSRGFCNMHYARWRKHGDPGQGSPQRVRGVTSCSIDGCSESNQARAMCANHYWSWRTYGDPLKAKQNKAQRGHKEETCSVDTCETAPRRAGLCGVHHHRELKYGHPLGKPEPKAARACSVDGCAAKSRAIGLCGKHYARYRNTGHTLGSIPRIKAPTKACDVVACEERHYSHGYCARHSYSFKKYGSPTEAEERAARAAALAASGQRVCTGCGETRCVEEFPRNPASKKDGAYSRCTSCVSRASKERYAKNRERYLAKGAEWRAQNPHKAHEKYLANKELYLESSKRRKAMLRGDGSERGITVRSLQKRHGDSCCYCGIDMLFNTDTKYLPNKATLEHVLPLSRGGKHTFDNCRIACYACNLAKNNKTLDEWVPEWLGTPTARLDSQATGRLYANRSSNEQAGDANGKHLKAVA